MLAKISYTYLEALQHYKYSLVGSKGGKYVHIQVSICAPVKKRQKKLHMSYSIWTFIKLKSKGAIMLT